jgi:hypothetical protein
VWAGRGEDLCVDADRRRNCEHHPHYTTHSSGGYRSTG